MFGETTKVKKSFRITEISLGSSDMDRAIKALEYAGVCLRPVVLDDVATSLMPPVLDPSQAAIGVVQSLTAYEEADVQGRRPLAVRATWTQPVATTCGRKVFVQKNGRRVQPHGHGPCRHELYCAGRAKGDQLTIKVQAYDIRGSDRLMTSRRW